MIYLFFYEKSFSILIYSIMRYLKLFENFEEEKSVLIIIDVQKSFRKFFTEMYLHELKKYCQTFDEVYQIWDNHVEGKNPKTDYLYDEDVEEAITDDVYTFPNQVALIEKRYNYDVDADFYKNILSKEVYQEIKNKEQNKSLKRGDVFPTNQGTIIVYIGNNHQWYHCPKKIYNLFQKFQGKEIKMVGGSDQECFLDVEVTALALGVKVVRDFRFIWSASNCPIK